MKFRWESFLYFLASLLLPLFLILTSIRVLILPWFPHFEYRLPYFPADSYGFSREERLKYAIPTINYLNNDAGIDLLESLKFADGSPIYNERELDHMLDVKVLVTNAMRGWRVLVVFFMGVWLYSTRLDRQTQLRKALARGGWWTIYLIAAILLGVAISFSWLFTLFHRLFFEGDTWLFYYSDTLIRLFPMVFWRDAFIFMGLLTVALAVGCILWGRQPLKRAPGSYS